MNTKGYLRVDYGSQREASWPILILFMIGDIASTVFINLVVFRHNWLSAASRTTHGLINSTLIVNVGVILLNVVVIMVVIGKLKWHDLGLEWRKLPEAVLVTLLLWIGMQIFAAVYCLIEYGRLEWDSSWSSYGIAVVIGNLLAQFLGNALFEEIAFRSFLVNQLYKKLSRIVASHRRIGMLLALFFSQLIFALMHIPNRIFYGLSADEIVGQLPILFLIGVFLALVYYRTGNLFIAIGLHALLDAPTYIFAAKDDDVYVYYLLMCLLLVYWPYLGRLRINLNNVQSPS